MSRIGLVLMAALAPLTLVSGYLVDPPTTAPDDTIKDCSNWVVAGKSDTCDSLAESGGITLDELYLYNPSLKKDGCPVKEELSYCVEQNFGVPPVTSTSSAPTPTSTGNGVSTPTPTQEGMVSNCAKFHKVVSGNTCSVITKQYGISIEDFYKWNPDVKDDCSTLLLDYHVCVGLIGMTPGPTGTPTPTTTGNGISTPTPTQTGMVGNCNTFYKIKSGDNCAAIADTYKIDLKNFYKWNPAVGEDCSSLWVGYQVCVNIVGGTTIAPQPTSTTTGNGVSTPTPTQTGMVNNCNKFYQVKSGDNCAAIADTYKIDLKNFYKWNPAVGEDCASLWVGYQVCVNIIGGTTIAPQPSPTTTGNGISTPTPTQTGMVKSCDTFHKVVSGDTCQKIADNAGISLDKFYTWNPDVGSDCKSLWLGYHVCIGLI